MIRDALEHGMLVRRSQMAPEAMLGLLERHGSFVHRALEMLRTEGHTFRFCSWLAIAGVSLKTIQELAGHRTLSMTARYSHLSPDHKRQEMRKISSAPRVVTFPSATRTANS